MTEREARIAFNLIPTVGSVTLDRLTRAAGGSAAEAYALFPDKRDWEGNPPAWEKEIEQAARSHVKLITELDPDYPPQLKELASPPLVLYVVGDPSVLSRPGVALIGTRSSTAYGRETTERFAAELARAGWVIFSGLAAGIDAAAHRGALFGSGLTAGILGSALDKFYPPENRDLARKIVDAGGAVVSEFPFGRPPDPSTFPQRNRIVAALARGVVAVECPLKSGTLITCSRAVELGRSVMAVPGRVDSRASAGCLHLLRDGARLVTNTADIIEELTPIRAKLRGAPPPRSPAATLPKAAADGKSTPTVRPSVLPEVRMSLEEARILREVSDTGCAVDAVIRGAGLAASKVNALLVSLRLKGKVRFLPGNRVATARKR